MTREEFAKLKYVGLSSRKDEGTGTVHITLTNRLTGETSHGSDADYEEAYRKAMEGQSIAREAKAS